MWENVVAVLTKFPVDSQMGHSVFNQVRTTATWSFRGFLTSNPISRSNPFLKSSQGLITAPCPSCLQLYLSQNQVFKD